MKRKISIIIMPLLFIIIGVIGIAGCTGCSRRDDVPKVENVQLSFIVDGSVYDTISTTGNEIIKMPTNPQKVGYVFDGWYWDNDVWSKPFTADSLLNEPISSNKNVYAKFSSIIEKPYSLYFVVDGVTYSTVQTNGNEIVTLPNNPSKSNYTLHKCNKGYFACICF